VFVADNFRDNLIIDRFDPVFSGMRASKLKHMRSENSEDVVSWNVFRSLRQINPAEWLPILIERGLGSGITLSIEGTTVDLWKIVKPPTSLLDGGDEGDSEIDIIIENPRWVWFIEAKLNSDVSTGTTTRPDRDQVLRNIDVGSYYSGVRPFYFSLLYRSEGRSSEGVGAINLYQDFQIVRERLPHRSDGLRNLSAIGSLTWGDIRETLAAVSLRTKRSQEHFYAQNCIEWLQSRGI